MRKAVITAFVFAACILLQVACGGSHGRQASQPTPAAVSSFQSANYLASKPRTFSDEDHRIMAMSYAERAAYLERKLKQLVFEMHGIVVEETVADSKTSSDGNSSGHKVEQNDSIPVSPLRNNKFVQEYLAISLEDVDYSWSISFLERLQGDYNYDGLVSVSDLTPLAVYFGHFWDDDPDFIPWAEDSDPHLNRVSDMNDKISVADITQSR